MHDQADELRQLVRQRIRTGHVQAPRWMTVFGGKGGVGTTTVALGIAESLALAGRRVVLVDGDFVGPDLASMTGIEPRYSVCDVLASRRSVHETLEQGPHGMQLLLGPPPDRRPVECSPTAQERLLDQLRSLGPHADVVIVDAGAAIGRAMRRFWQAADDLLLVTTPDPLAVTDTYAALKQLYTREPNQAVHAVVNKGAEPAESAAVGDRFGEACRRFLALSLASVVAVPGDPQLTSGARNHDPAALATRGLAASQFDAWVERWLAQRAAEPVGLAERSGRRQAEIAPSRVETSNCELSL